jgi:azurin
MTIRTLLLATAALTLAACGGPDTGVETASTPAAPAAPAAAPAPEPAVAYDGPPAEVTIAPVGDEMKFEQTEFTVAPGQTVHLTFTNTATSAAMRHNVVVLDPGTDVAQFGQASASASGTDYIPRRLEDSIVAHTAMSGPGETVEVTFTAPTTPGDYVYICSYPGHYTTMKGTMRVVAQPA